MPSVPFQSSPSRKRRVQHPQRCRGCGVGLAYPSGRICGTPYCSICFWIAFNYPGPTLKHYRHHLRQERIAAYWTEAARCPCCCPLDTRNDPVV